jgi:hypothetical protein
MLSLAQAGMPSDKAGKTNENNMNAGTGNRQDIDGAGESNGPRNNATGASAYLGLPARDRSAILQSTSEGRPQEYSTQIEQYLRNLSDQENQ